MHDILHRLTTLYPKAIEPGLERTLRILNDLGNPHLKLPPVIHIAGTNGKGSTLAFIRALLEASGKKCHVMTSPHLVKFNERLVVASREISDAALEDVLLRTEKRNARKPVTFFEITTAAGFLAFSETKADFCLLETGMGGRLDSTNVVPAPILTVITNISFDHMQHLGDSLEKIAFEKACIMKQGCPCVLGPMSAALLPVFERRANELNTKLYRYGQEWSYMETPSGFDLTFENKIYSCPKPNLVGRHQIANAALAAASILILNPSFLRKQESLFVALTQANWPARLQKIESGSLFNLLPAGWELWLDGGHNEDGGRILAAQAQDWQNQDGKPLHLVLGMLTTKDPEPFYAYLKPYPVSATAIPIPDEKLAFPSHGLALALAIREQPSIEAALSMLGANYPAGRILVTGSLYLAGHILRSNF